MSSITPSSNADFSASSTSRLAAPTISAKTPATPPVINKTSVESSVSPSDENPEAKERYNQLLKDSTTILTQTDTLFTERDSKKLQKQLKELKELQGKLKPANTQSLTTLNETLSIAYGKVTGNNFASQDSYISPDVLEQVVGTEVTLEDQFQSTTVSAEAQKIIDEGEISDLQNEIQNTQKMVDELNAKIKSLGAEGGGADIDEQIKKLKEQIATLEKQNTLLAEDIKTREAELAHQKAILAELEKAQNIANTHPIPDSTTQNFFDLLANALNTRDSLQQILNTLDKNDPYYSKVNQALNDLLISYPLATYPVGTGITKEATHSTYYKGANYDWFMSTFSFLYSEAQMQNFLKYINGDKTASYPQIYDWEKMKYRNMTEQEINDLKKNCFELKVDATINVITKPGGEKIDNSVAANSLSTFVGYKNEIGNIVNEINSDIASNQATIDSDQASISANLQEIAATKQSMQDLLVAENQVAQEMQNIRDEINSLIEKNKVLADQLNAAQAIINSQQSILALLEKAQQIVNTKPIPGENTQDFINLFNNAIQTRDSLQKLLTTLDKNDPNYAGVTKILNDLLQAYPLETYPAGTVATANATKVEYSKGPAYDLFTTGWLKNPLYTQDFLDNFLAYIKGDKTATTPLNELGKPMTPDEINQTISLLYDVKVVSSVTVISKPDGTKIDSAVAANSLSQFLNSKQDIDLTINEVKAVISSNQAIVNSDSATIKANTDEINAKNSSLQELINSEKDRMQKLINDNKDFKEVIDRLSGIIADVNEPGTFSLNRLIACLIDLCQVMQKMASAETMRLSVVTKKMSAYSQLLTQVPVLTTADTDSGTRDKYNPKYQAAQEAIRMNKSAEEDLAKQVQSLLQSVKDASQSIEDFIGTILNMMASISQKIAR